MNEHSPLTAISPVDGRYYHKLQNLSHYFSEYAYIFYRVKVEIHYLIALSKLEELPLTFLQAHEERLKEVINHFSLEDAQEIKAIERQTNHDVKAIEYWLRKRLKEVFSSLLSSQQCNYVLAFIHFGLTSQDVNNTALPWMIKDFLQQEFFPLVQTLERDLHAKAEQWQAITMLGFTHGQPASPTSLGKESKVFAVRLSEALTQIKAVRLKGKFGGATGNFNAHYFAYPQVSWHQFAELFLRSLGIERSFPTTQIDPYDSLAQLFDAIKRLNTILIDFAQDMWLYISKGYFRLRAIAEEVGSSTMPHKVNPIHFENAEGNLHLANALWEFLARKLPVSRLQRDLTDSTIVRNIGVPFAHTFLGIQNLIEGLQRLTPETTTIENDLNEHPEVLTEAIQTLLRQNGIVDAYERLKHFSRGQKRTMGELHEFIKSLPLSEEQKQQLLNLRVGDYRGQ